MGMYVNPSNESFISDVNSNIYMWIRQGLKNT